MTTSSCARLLAIVVALALPASAALAEGAIAIGIPPAGVAKGGFAYGTPGADRAQACQVSDSGCDTRP
jgi:hypothetical protein